MLLTTILALFTSGVFAASASLEVQDLAGKNTTPDMKAAILSVKENVSKNFIGDITFTDVRISTNNAIVNRLEAGLTGSMPLVGPFTGFIRTAVGQRYSSVSDFSYYSITPGVRAPIGNTGFHTSVSYRYRNAFDATANTDLTRTWRGDLGYDITKQDRIGISYMNVSGDAQQDIYAINYSRRF